MNNTALKNKNSYSLICIFFLISGFCGLLYQIVWLRLGLATFGITTQILSVVVSVFMMGLAIGSWAGGKYIERIVKLTGLSAIVFYGLTEFLIGLGGIAVPFLFKAGQYMLLSAGDLNSFNYLFLSALVLTISILPWCILMGSTIPIMMAFMRQIYSANKTSFSYLYSANVIGAMLGALVTAWVLIELVGFRSTSRIAVFFNFAIAIASVIIYYFNRNFYTNVSLERVPASVWPEPITSFKPKIAFIILFTTGFTSMAMEVIWTRTFTPTLLSTIYSFSAILVVYLLATWLGTLSYRRDMLKSQPIDPHLLIANLAWICLLPIIAGDFRVLGLFPCFGGKAFLVLASIFPFSFIVGYLTSSIIDRFSKGDPKYAGTAYAINGFGCVLGPLFAGYLFLPVFGIRYSMIFLSLPFLFIFIYHAFKKNIPEKNYSRSVFASLLTGAILFGSSTYFFSFEDMYASKPDSVVRRDFTATTVASGKGMRKGLLVNGIGMTDLTQATKWMAHLPLAACGQKPKSALVICFGMGTTFRSIDSWGIRVTAVELVPAVKELFSFFFNDAEKILSKPTTSIIIDDGRRYLNRTTETFDVITIDPPPPVEASGSSLLYSEEFYKILKTKLRKGGIAQQWMPSGDPMTICAITNSIKRSFPFVRIFPRADGPGLHFLASMERIDMPTADEFINKLPPEALKDLTEWMKLEDPRDLYNTMLTREIPVELLAGPSITFSVTDDTPINEFFFMRSLLYNYPHKDRAGKRA